MNIERARLVVVLFAFLLAGWTSADAQCPAEPDLQNWTGGGQVACPCFVPGEEAGAILDVPASEYPIEILRIGVGWGSQFGGSPDTLEQSIHVYEGGLPNPGAPIFSLDGPVLTDGVINLFDIEPLPGEVIINSGPFTVTLEFANQSAGDPFTPAVIHDGTECQDGKNVVFAQPGGWIDACLAGVTGDWIFHVVYRPVSCGTPTPAGTVPDGALVPGTPLIVDKFSTSLLLSWDDSCTTTDTDYEIYEGTVGSYYSHSQKLCSTGGATGAIVSPAPGDTYYLVVPANDEGEGSYGINSAGDERDVGLSQCIAQQSGPCP